MKIKKFLNQFYKDETGQSTTEYILILAVVVMIAMKFKGVFGSKIEGITKDLMGSIGEAAKIDSSQ
ncbi:MAG: hypothetical protein AABZ55_09930 [Bdellovibrionota bacterium]